MQPLCSAWPRLRGAYLWAALVFLIVAVAAAYLLPAQPRLTITSRGNVVQLLTDSQTLLTYHGQDEEYRGPIWLLDAGTGRDLGSLLTDEDKIERLASSPDGQFLAVVFNETELQLHELRTGRLRGVLNPDRERIRKLAVSPDSQWLAVGVGSNGLELVEMATGQVVARFQVVDHLSGFCFAPDSQTFAFATSEGGRKDVMLWDLPQRHMRHTLRGVGPPLQYSPESKLLAALGQDREHIQCPRLWDVSTGKEYATLPSLFHPPEQCLCFSPDGKLFLAWGTSAWRDKEADMIVWDVEARGQFAVLKAYSFDSVTLSPDSLTVAAFSGGPSNLRVWDLRTGQQRFATTTQGGLLFTPDSKALITVPWNVMVLDVETGQELVSYDLQPVGYVSLLGRDVWGPHLSPDGQKLRWTAGADKEHLSYMPDVAYPALRNLPGNIRSFLPGETRVDRYDLTVVDMATRQVVMKETDTTPIYAVFVSDGKTLVSGQTQGVRPVIRYWDLPPQKPVAWIVALAAAAALLVLLLTVRPRRCRKSS